MMNDFFPNQKSVAIFNMDVNYLKRVNDTLGHEAGDALIVKAAKSLLAVEKDNVRGFRMGGDEFMLFGWDMEEDEANALKKEWEGALAKLNEENDGLECVIACGLAYGKDEFDLKELLKLADERMYENKVAIKLSRGEDPNAR
jgi:diguanylate cyclase (GGDEF)-like protein